MIQTSQLSSALGQTEQFVSFQGQVIERHQLKETLGEVFELEANRNVSSDSI